MKDFFWYATDPTEALTEWVSSNVQEAIRYFWEDEPPDIWIGDNEDGIVIELIGPGKPTEKDPTGGSDNYVITLDLMDSMLRYVCMDVTMASDMNQACKDATQHRINAMRKLAEKIKELSDDIENRYIKH